MASVVMTLLSIAALITGAHLMVTHAVSIATSFEIDKAVIGATIVAIGTSLPEITAVMASLLKGRQDMAVGNIIGSNMFNICIVLGITAMAAPLPASPSLLFTILPFFVLSSLFLLGLSWDPAMPADAKAPPFLAFMAVLQASVMCYGCKNCTQLAATVSEKYHFGYF